MTSKYAEISELIASAKGRFISVEFYKKDGTLRQMSVQPAAIKKHIKGDDASDEAKRRTAVRKANNPHLLPVWDNGKQAIRSINMDTVVRVAIDGEVHEYEVDRGNA